MVLLALEIGVEERLVALAAAPEDIIFAAEFERDLEGFLHLSSGVGEDMGIGIGGGAAHIARIREEVGRAPEEFDAGGFLQRLGVGHERIEMLVGLGERAALGRNVAVVEAPERRADFLKKFKRGVHPGLRDGDCVRTLFPRAHDRAGAERIAARAAKAVPIRDRKPQVLRERAAVDDLVRVVVFERECVFRLRAFVGDDGEAGEVRFGHGREGNATETPRVAKGERGLA